MRILLTRPRSDSEALAKLLRARGHEAVIEPMLDIVPTDAAVSLDGVQAILATSANGIRALAAATEARALPVFAVGDATARAATEAGFTAVESAAGDGAALAKLVTSRARPDSGALLHVRGREAAGDPAEALAAAGFEVRAAVLYDATPATALWPVLRERIAAGGLDAALFFSPRTAQTFVTLARDAGIAEACGRITALCLSQAVAEAASPLPWREIRVAASPNQAALLKELDHVAGTVAGTQGDRPSVTDATEKKPTPSTLEKAAARDAAKDAEERKPAGAGAAGTASRPGTAGARPAQADARRSRPVIVAVALAVLLLLALAWIAWPLWGPAMPGGLRTALAPVMEAGRGSGVGGRVEELSGRIAALERDFASLRSQLAARPDIDPQRLSVVEESVRDTAAQLQAVRRQLIDTDLGAAVASLKERLDRLESRIAALSAGPGGEEAVAALEALRAQSAARMARLEQGNLALRQAMEELNRQIAALAERPQAAGTTRATALVLAVGQLREAARGTGPFAEALSAVKALAGDDAALQQPIAALEAHAQDGVPDLTALRLRFDRIAGRIAHEAYVPEGDGWVDRTLQRLARIVTIRRADREAAARDDENGRVARAELRLAAGDLAGAVEALDGLTGEAAEIARPWLAAARDRLAVARAIEALYAEALTRTAGETQGAPPGSGSGAGGG